RPGPGRPQPRQHHLDLYLCLVGLQDPDAAPGAGRHGRRRPRRPGVSGARRRDGRAAMTRQKRTVSYQWRLRAVMAEHGMYATTELVPLLAERGVVLSA